MTNCQPPANPCRTRNYPLFNPGISTRMVPDCAPPSCEGLSSGAPSWRVNSAGTLDRSRWIEGWIINQLLARGRVECDESPLGKADGGWWADSFRKDGFRSGSKLWSLKWSRSSNETLMTAKQYAEEALRYLVGWGVASKVNVDALFANKGVIHLAITVSGPGVASTVTVEGQRHPDYSYLWAEYQAKA